MNVLVTGGRGFIGQAVEAELAHRGITSDVFGLEDGGIEDAEAVASAVKGHDAVIHLAGVLGTHELFDTVDEAIAVNVGGTANVLEACRRYNVGYVGITMPQVFPSIYTATKIAATHLASAYHQTYGISVAHVRAFNAFGPGQAHGPGHPQKIVPTFAAQAWAGQPIPIWGDGTQTVDLIHVDQLARMLVDAIGFGSDEVFDGGTGTALTVNEVADFVLAVTGSKAGVEYLPMRRGETPTTIRATGEGWDRLGWRPAFNWRQLGDTVRAYRP